MLAFLIVLFHVINSKLLSFDALSHGPFLTFLRSFEYGVELFFALSGIVIVGALRRAPSPFVFAIERCTRIYPVLWASILVLVILSGLSGYEGRSWPSPWVFTANLLALPPLLPVQLIHPAAWSLCYEFLFYAFCALTWVFRRRIGSLVWFTAVPLAAYFLYYHVRAIFMPLGMLVVVAMEHQPRLSRFTPEPGLLLLGFLFAWETLAEIHGSAIDDNFIGIATASEIIGMAFALVLAFLSFCGILAGRGLLAKALNTAPLQFLGTISYSLYLWHPLVMPIVKHGMYVLNLPTKLGSLSQAVFLFLVLPPSLLIAWASQQTLEKRLTRWLRRKLEPARRATPRPDAPMTSAH